jgi:hypothetical protein
MGFLTMWNELLQLHQYLTPDDGDPQAWKLKLIDVEDVGLIEGVGKGYEERYELNKGESYRSYAESFRMDYLSEMTADEIECIPTVMWARAKLVAEHNEVRRITFCSHRCFFYITNYINNIHFPTTQINTLVVG